MVRDIFTIQPENCCISKCCRLLLHQLSPFSSLHSFRGSLIPGFLFRQQELNHAQVYRGFQATLLPELRGALPHGFLRGGVRVHGACELGEANVVVHWRKIVAWSMEGRCSG